MTNRGAIETIKREIADIVNNPERIYPDSVYEFLNALKLAIAALEKQEPMEVAEIHCDEYYCPSCGSENMADCYKVGDNYCPRCGQALLKREGSKCLSQD